PVTEPASVDDDATAAADAVDETPEAAADVAPEAEAEAAAPSVGISVQAFRGVGADAGPEVALPTEQESARPAVAPKPPSSAPTTPAAPVKRTLPLAAALPPEQTETVPGMKDNVLLREALAELAEGATNEQLLGVLRQALQGHLY